MELVVGENSYISLEEADELIKTIYLSSDKNRKFYEGLTEEDKMTLILSATAKLENVQNLWIGSKLDRNQSMQFPRIEDNGAKGQRQIEFNTQMKTGLLRMCVEAYAHEHSDEHQMILKGVQSYKIKDASITFSVGSKTTTQTEIPISIWRQYFSQYSLIS